MGIVIGAMLLYCLGAVLLASVAENRNRTPKHRAE